MNPITQLPAPVGSNVIPMYTTRPAKARATRDAVLRAARRAGLSQNTACYLVIEATDAFLAGASPARAIAEARQQIQLLRRDCQHG